MNQGALTIRMGVDTSAVTRAIGTMKQFERSVMGSVSNINAQLKTMTQTLNAMTATLGSMSQAMAKQQQQATQTTQQTGAAAQTSAAAVSKVGKEAGSTLDSFNDKLKGLNSNLQRFGFVALSSLTIPLAGIGKAAFNAAKEYEFSLAKIEGLTNASREDVEEWTDSIKKLGPEVGKAPTELAKAMYFISTAGIVGKEAMDVLTVSAKAATAGMGDTEKVAQTLTSALNAYRGTGLTALKATDILVAAVREGKAEADGFASALGQIIPIAANIGVSFDQVAGGMAAITLTGSSAANAAVYLKGVFNSLLTASTQGQEALKKAGTSYGQLRKILSEQGLIPLMQKLRDIQAKYGDELLSDVIPNIRALTGYMSLAGKNFQYNSELMKRVTNSSGALAKAFGEVSDTIKVRWDKAMASLQNTAIDLGKSLATSLLPLVEKWVKKLKDASDAFDKLTDAQKRHRIEFALFVAMLGPAALLFSSFVWIARGAIAVFMGLGKALTFARAASIGLSGSFGGLRTALTMSPGITRGLFGLLRLLGPIGGPAVAIGAAVAATTVVVHKFMKKMYDAADAHRAFNTVAVDVNGTLKKMKELTAVDMQSMDAQALTNIRNLATNNINRLNQEIRTAVENSGMKWEDFEKGDKVPIRYREFVNRSIDERKRWAEAYQTAGKAIADLNLDRLIEMQDKYNESLKENTDGTSKNNETLNAHKKYLDAVGDSYKQEGKLLDNLAFSYSRYTKQMDLYKKKSQRGEGPNTSEIVSGGFALGERGVSGITGGRGMNPQFDTTDMQRFMMRTSNFNKGGPSDVMIELGKQLEYINARETVLATTLGKTRDLYNEIGAQINAYGRALDELMEKPLSGRDAQWTQEVSTVLNNMEALKKQFEAMEEKKRMIENFASVMEDSFTQAFMNMEQGAKAFFDTILEGIKRMVAELLARKLTMWLINNLFPGSGMGLGGVTGGANWQAPNVTGMDSFTSMANRDYVNNMTTRSGNLIPAASLKGLAMGNQMEGVVTFEIHQDVLKGILNKADKKNSLF